MKSSHDKLLWLLALCIPSIAIAQDQNLYKMPTVYVSSSRLPETSNLSGSQVTIIDSNEIAQMGVSTIAEILNLNASTHSRARGPLGVQTDVEMNGATFSQILILVDGLRVNDPQTGHHNLNLPIRPQDLERIEINHSAGSGVHGPDAFGGIINLVTRHDVQKKISVSNHWGPTPQDNSDVSGVATSTRLSHGWQGNWGNFNLSAGRERSDGYRDTTELNSDHLNARFRLPIGSGHLKLNAGIEKKAFGANDFYGNYPSKEWTTAGLYSARFERKGNVGKPLVSSFIYRRHKDRFVLWRHNPSAYENSHLSEVVTLSTHVGSKLAGGDIVVGGEINGERVDSSNLGKHQQERLGFFGEWAMPIKSLQFNIRSRMDISSVYGSEWAPGFQLSSNHDRWNIFAGVQRTFRAPSFNELYYQSPSNQGDPNLAAERAWAYNFGSLFKLSPKVRLKVNSYLRAEQNVIDWTKSVTDDGGNIPPWNAQNLGEMQSRGGSLETTYENRQSEVKISITYSLHDKSRKLPNNIVSKYVFAQPRHQIDYRILLPLFSNLKAVGHYQYREHSTENHYGVGSFILTRKIDAGHLQLKINNLGNTQYEYVTGVPMPGRWFAIETTLNL